MLPTIRNFHRQFLETYKVSHQIHLKISGKKIKNICLAGMGGSALPADMLNDYLAGTPRITIIRHYTLPENIGKGDLVFCSSYSGNTEETLSAFDQAVKRKAFVFVLTHGGELKNRAVKRSVPLMEIPDCVQPRCATGFFVGAMLGVLEKIKIIGPQAKNLKALVTFLQGSHAECEGLGKQLADKLVDHVPLIYGPDELRGISRVFKIKINENAKVQSFSNDFPELNHNEMVGFTKMIMKPAVICLRSRQAHPRIGKRMDVMKELLEGRMPFHDVCLKGQNLLQEMFYGYLIADYTSYYLALNYGVDPAPVAMVEDFKKRLF